MLICRHLLNSTILCRVVLLIYGWKQYRTQPARYILQGLSRIRTVCGLYFSLHSCSSGVPSGIPSNSNYTRGLSSEECINKFYVIIYQMFGARTCGNQRCAPCIFDTCRPDPVWNEKRCGKIGFWGRSQSIFSPMWRKKKKKVCSFFVESAKIT